MSPSGRDRTRSLIRTTPSPFRPSSTNGAMTRTRKNAPSVEPPLRNVNSGAGYDCEMAVPAVTRIASSTAATIVATTAP